MQGVGDFPRRFSQTRANFQLPVRDLPVTVANKGIGGQSTPAMLARVVR